ncbi:hypothetical protein ACCO45_000013 [Purpureocillium lilacinum]|uniref:Uncharacterized protein n=1 Tax=Purpureocillium lilacinum TaxID=33203 RepID=A0ACC4ECF1_PURLI
MGDKRGDDILSNEEVAIKLVRTRTTPGFSNTKKASTEHLQEGPAYPKSFWGPSLEDLFNFCGRRFSLKTVLLIADQAISRIKQFSDGRREARSVLYTIDFGLAQEFSGLASEGRGHGRTLRYASINNHNRRKQSWCDDLESLGYVLLYFIRGSLPWQGRKAATEEEKDDLIKDMKTNTSPSRLCEGLPEEFAIYLGYVRSLGFEDRPDYAYLRHLFDRLFVSSGFKHDNVFDWTEKRFNELHGLVRDLPQHEVAGCPSSNAGDTRSGKLIARYKAGRSPCDPSSKPFFFTALDPVPSVLTHCPNKPDDRKNSSDDAPNDTQSERRRRPPECCRLPRASEGRGSDGRRRQHSSTYSGLPVEQGLYKNGAVFSESATRSSEGRARLLMVALELRQKALIARPTKTHRLLDTLRIRGQLLRCYTQNIDMLEEKAGLSVGVEPGYNCVPLHGSLHHLRCPSCCGLFSNWADYDAFITAGDAVLCPSCAAACQARVGAGRRRSYIGQLLPDIVLLGGEHRDGEAIESIIAKDVAAGPDFLLVLGTSLRAHGPKRLASRLARAVSGRHGTVVYVDLSKRCSWSRRVDFHVRMPCDEWVEDLRRRKSIVQGGSGSAEDPIVID